MCPQTSRRIATAALLSVATALAGCGDCRQSATFPSRWLPSPWPGYHGTGEKLTSGAAFGVAIGAERGRAHAELEGAGRFHRTGTFCSLPGFDEYQPDLREPLDAIDKPQTACPKADNIDEVWASDPSIFCGLCQAEILDLWIVHDRVARIEFRGSGCML